MNKISSNVIIKEGVVFGDNIVIEEGCYIDIGAIIRDDVHIKKGTYIGARCILGEYQSDFLYNLKNSRHPLIIGSNSVIRSETIIYGDTNIGDNFQTGHRVTIREKTIIGNNVSVGTLSDIQGNCKIGNYVRMHSNVHVGQLSTIDDFVWIFPYVVLTNDPTPPSENFVGVHLCSFSIVATGSVLMPGITVETDSLVGAGAIVTKNVHRYEVVVGSPAKVITDIRNIKNKVTGEPVYPWKLHFSKYMPWEKTGFEEWYASLSIEEKKRLE